MVFTGRGGKLVSKLWLRLSRRFYLVTRFQRLLNEQLLRSGSLDPLSTISEARESSSFAKFAKYGSE